MRLIDALNNLKNYNAWEYSNYKLCKDEADALIAAAEKVMEEEKGGTDEK